MSRISLAFLGSRSKAFKADNNAQQGNELQKHMMPILFITLEVSVELDASDRIVMVKPLFLVVIV